MILSPKSILPKSDIEPEIIVSQSKYKIFFTFCERIFPANNLVNADDGHREEVSEEGIFNSGVSIISVSQSYLLAISLNLSLFD